MTGNVHSSVSVSELNFIQDAFRFVSWTAWLKIIKTEYKKKSATEITAVQMNLFCRKVASLLDFFLPKINIIRFQECIIQLSYT